MNDKIFKVILLILAIGIATIAAYFSVFGLSKLFAGAMMAVIVMASALEVGKLAAATFLKRYWDSINAWLRVYLMAAVFILMGITSIGIYGFLSSAYQQTSTGLVIATKQANIIESKKNLYVADIDAYKRQIESYENRIKTLSGIRTDQEKRLSSQYATNTYGFAKRTETNINQSDQTISKLYDDIKLVNTKVATLNDSITKWDLQILELKNNDYAADLGPLIYIANITNKSMDQIVNILILLFILVFDPLAIMFVVSLNHATVIEIKTKAKIALKEKPKEKNMVDDVFKQYKKKSRYKSKAQRLAEQQSVPAARNILEK